MLIGLQHGGCRDLKQIVVHVQSVHGKGRGWGADDVSVPSAGILAAAEVPDEASAGAFKGDPILEHVLDLPSCRTPCYAPAQLDHHHNAGTNSPVGAFVFPLSLSRFQDEKGSHPPERVPDANLRACPGHTHSQQAAFRAALPPPQSPLNEQAVPKKVREGILFHHHAFKPVWINHFPIHAIFSRSRRAVTRLKWVPGEGMPQASLATCVLASAQLCHHNMAAVWPLDRVAPAPNKMVLHFVLGGSPEALGVLRSHSAEDLRMLMAAWVESQASGQEVCLPFNLYG